MKELLGYQDLDIEIKKMERELQENSDRQNALKMQQYLKDCQAKLIQLGDKAQNIVNAYHQYKDVYTKMAQNVELISKNANSSDENKLNGLLDATASIIENLNKLEKEIASVIASCAALDNEQVSIMKNARTAKVNMEKYKENYASTKKIQEEAILAKKKKLEELGKTVNKDLLAKYKQRSAEKNKVFVPVVSGKCGGCRMEIPAGKMNILKNNKFIECENCGRIIYSD